MKFINKLTGTEMWVADDRVEKYTAAGHIPAAVFPMNKPTGAVATEVPKEEKKPRRTRAKK